MCKIHIVRASELAVVARATLWHIFLTGEEYLSHFVTCVTTSQLVRPDKKHYVSICFTSSEQVSP